MHPALQDFIFDVPELAPYLHALARAADTNPHQRAKLAAITWIAGQDRSLLEKVDAMQRLEHLPEGRVHIPSMEEFCWGDTNATRVLQ